MDRPEEPGQQWVQSGTGSRGWGSCRAGGSNKERGLGGAGLLPAAFSGVSLWPPHLRGWRLTAPPVRLEQEGRERQVGPHARHWTKHPESTRAPTCNPNLSSLPPFLRAVAAGRHPCADRNGGCMHTCRALRGVAHCECHAGYQLAADRKACEGKPRPSLEPAPRSAPPILGPRPRLAPPQGPLRPAAWG